MLCLCHPPSLMCAIISHRLSSPPPSTPALQNLALGKPVYSSSTYLHYWPLQPEFAVDGITNYTSDLPIFQSDDSDPYPWFSLDLTAVERIWKVVIWNRCDCCEERLNATLRIGNFRVTQPSESGNITLNPLVWTQNATLGACLGQSIIFDVPIFGQWVIIENRNDVLHLTEVEVFPVPGMLIHRSVMTSEVIT